MSFEIIAPREPNHEPEPEGPELISPGEVETPDEFRSVPEDFPALSEVEFNGPMLEDPMRGVGAGIVLWMKHVPPCIWVKNGSDEQIVVRVSKIKPERIINQVNIEGSLTGARIGGEATLVRFPAMQVHLGQGKVQRFPFWSWKDTQVNVTVKYDGKIFVYTLKAGSLGVFREPQSGVMECWTWQGKSLDTEHPALQQRSPVVMRGPPEHQ
ncbi:hypothetical protein EHS25_006568 [Saitozyma podzolica]|uniref:Uncharacterized protein n=1 Tax=Saitozyma podzolica TaxID=1890683 RepID=A0A427YSB7_9TREE|nr:hypothetical protein EHS25_006568 [Saitozyma podzolica]